MHKHAELHLRLAVYLAGSLLVGVATGFAPSALIAYVVGWILAVAAEGISSRRRDRLAEKRLSEALR